MYIFLKKNIRETSSGYIYLLQFMLFKLLPKSPELVLMLLQVSLQSQVCLVSLLVSGLQKKMIEIKKMILHYDM